MAIEPSLRQLRIFVAIARNGGVAGAARALRLGPPTVSVALRELEGALGVELFERRAQRLHLTAAGHALLTDAEALLSQARSLAGRHGRRRLALGASVTVGNYLLAPIIQALRISHPELELGVVVRNTQAMAQAVRAGEVELAFVEGPVAPDDLYALPWRDDELAIIAAPSHPLAHGADPEALQAADWILREAGAGTRDAFDAMAEAWPQPPRVSMTLGGNELIKAMVRAGLGLSCLSRAAVAPEIARGELAEVERAPLLTRPLTIISRVPPPRTGPILTLLTACGLTEPKPAANLAM
jgi:DNA-binding transcriptional LysR family regulator